VKMSSGVLGAAPVVVFFFCLAPVAMAFER
jgi:hypothetical protein